MHACFCCMWFRLVLWSQVGRKTLTRLINCIKLRCVDWQPETVLCELGAAVSKCRVEHLLNHRLPPRLVAADNTDLPDSVQTVLNHLSPLLAADQRSVRLTAYHLLSKLVPQLAQHAVDMVNCSLIHCRKHLPPCWFWVRRADMFHPNPQSQL